MSTRNIFYDTEFLEDGRTIDLISIGLVCDDGSEYYAVNDDCDFHRVKTHPWLWENVVPSLPTVVEKPPAPAGPFIDPDLLHRTLSIGTPSNVQYTKLDRSSPAVKPKWVIANEVREFITGHHDMGDRPVLWANFAAFDHVALAWLFGPMSELPKGIPMYTNDIQQLLDRLPFSMREDKPVQEGGEHNALEDARHNLAVYDYAMEHLASKGRV